MTAVELLEWLAENYSDENVFNEVFGNDYTMGGLVNKVGAEEAVRKIEKYEAQRKKVSDMNIEWVYKVESEYGYLYVKSEDEAIELCEEWARNYHTYAEYHKVCREVVE